MSMKNILDEKEGSPITVYEVLQYQHFKHHRSGKTNTLFIIYRDEKNKKKVKAIRNPMMEIFFLKPEYRGQFFTPREYIEIDHTYPMTVPAKDVLSAIHQEMVGATDPEGVALNRIYENAVATGNWTAKKEIFKWPYTFMSDTNVEDYYRIMLGYHYDTMHGHVINKCFLDIENDVLGLTNSELLANMDPTNACTLIFNFDEYENGKKRDPLVFTFLLRNHKRYPQQEEFEKNIDKFYKACHEAFDHQTVIKNGKKKVIDTPARYKIMFYDSEPEMLQAIFDTINGLRPDVCEVWNIAYDLPKLKGRMEHFGMNHVDVMSDKAFPADSRFVEMNIDNRAGVDIADRKTYIRMTSTTLYMDQMQNYAGIRKGQKAYGANSLDNIAKVELGMGKWEFKKGINVFNAAIKDYWNFVLYNIRDVWCQVLIDTVTNDSMAMIYDMNQANCPLQNLTKQTKYQKQIYYTNYLRKGVVPGNNPNVDYIRYGSEEVMEAVNESRKKWKIRRTLDGEEMDEDETEDDVLAEEEFEGTEDDEDYEDSEAVAEAVKDVTDVYSDSIDRKLPLPGGLVGNPNFNSANGTELIDGVQSKHVFDEIMDADYSAEYPWAKVTRSLSKSTQIGRLIIPKKISDRQNKLPLGQEKRPADSKLYIPGAEFTADYLSQDYLSFGNVWFGLPSVAEVKEMIKEMVEKEGKMTVPVKDVSEEGDA